jgi:predicted DNA-binding transcriptional regulator AlpA
MDDRDLIRPAEMVRKLGVSRSWLYDAAKGGRIPSIRIGGPQGPLRFVPEDIERWLDQTRRECMFAGERPARLELARRRAPRTTRRRP